MVIYMGSKHVFMAYYYVCEWCGVYTSVVYMVCHECVCLKYSGMW